MPDIPSTSPICVPDKNAVILVCFIGDIRDRVVTVIEGENKPWKHRGQTGVIFETLEEGEAEHHAIERALLEELDLTLRDVSYVESKGGFFMDIESPPRGILFGTRVFLVQLKTSTKIKKVTKGEEILERKERDIVSLNGDTRPGTKTAITLALSKETQKKPLTIKVRDGSEI